MTAGVHGLSRLRAVEQELTSRKSNKAWLLELLRFGEKRPISIESIRENCGEFLAL